MHRIKQFMLCATGWNICRGCRPCTCCTCVLSSSRNMHISLVWFMVGQGDPVYQIEFALELGWQMKQILLGDLYSHDASLTMLLLFHLTTASFDLSSVAWSKLPMGNFFISFSTRLTRIVPVQAICFAVRQSTSVRDVTRLSNVKWNEFPTSSCSSEIRSMTTDPPMPSPSYCVCCTCAPW